MKISTREQRKIDKRKTMLDAARRIFATNGYTGASLDAIALEAGVSKPTIYQYFGNKEKLFKAVLEQAAEQILLPIANASSTQSMPASMLEFGRNYAQTVLSPEMLSLDRLVLGEVERFPQLGRSFYEQGPRKALDGIIRYLESLVDDGKLNIEDSELAAHDFWSLILSAPRGMCQLMPDLVMDSAEIDRYIFNGLRVFLMAYSAEPKTDLSELAKLAAHS